MQIREYRAVALTDLIKLESRYDEHGYSELEEMLAESDIGTWGDNSASLIRPDTILLHRWADEWKNDYPLFMKAVAEIPEGVFIDLEA